MVHRAARGQAQVYQLSPNSGLQVYGVRTFFSPGVRCRNVLILNFTLCTKSPRCTVYELLINSAPQVYGVPTCNVMWYTVHLVLVHKNSVHQGALVYQFLTTAVHNMYRIIIPGEEWAPGRWRRRSSGRG